MFFMRTGVGVPAVGAVGQIDFQCNGEDKCLAVTLDTLCWPYSLALFG
jgi:hypothetical protein